MTVSSATMRQHRCAFIVQFEHEECQGEIPAKTVGKLTTIHRFRRFGLRNLRNL